MDKWQTVVCIIVLVIVFAGVIIFVTNTARVSRAYSESEEIFSNPFAGFAPRAKRIEEVPDATLAYVEVRWSVWEPEEGRYDSAALEEAYKLSELRERGVHLVLRFICDYPEKEAHRDIPQWLYDKTGDGTDYHTTYGYGYCPDYKNKTFIEYHEKAIRALGEYLGGDNFVSYVELGSLGHWGEWHVKYSAGLPRLPLEKTREKYIVPYIEAFPNAEFLMRRPFSHAENHGFGLYNDMVGDTNETERWFGWIQNGGKYAQTDEENAIVPMPDAWETSPIGGEFTSGTEMRALLDADFGKTLSMIEKSHMTFIGPKIADAAYRDSYDRIRLSLGYRLRVSKITASRFFGKCSVKLEWTNDGAAPLYQDLSVYLVLADKDGNELERQSVDVTLSAILPKTTVKTETAFDTKNLDKMIKDGAKLRLEIIDPLTDKPAVRLAQNCPCEDGVNVLFD